MRITESRLRRIIREIISENVDVGSDKLANFEFVDLGLGKFNIRDFNDFTFTIFSLVEDFESGDYEVINKDLIELNLNFDGLKRLCIETSGRIRLFEQDWDGFIINKRVFDALGFTQNDINKILDHNREHNERCSRYDDMRPGAKLKGEEIHIHRHIN